ncbi:HoxN/HupN/NixA family nickel/cobalt transporter [Rhodoblastus acidophilus]|uniref:Nickel/cobalt efflux system n=1 Tax=Candidatus Rhodoblastus alkanivorans TaxID=2954117 RepID=A0ABS9Z3F1_9HYPH|nr:HoxN/HupN/NixA family nickel/cobalt transporter [Candidatus Rhodoblastus alkanivorans]MCI4677408.1 HoxN/HupN/NixA family nickel/cobalt transporter [Candidatus Rhodoblastus alkanivorans]MCI4682143.1 HoxN/HupN/NixA family nickel/cobalt transporter [Candidatus Rhodoblastus alkanivorans]MDI4639445.1 HoxN/HupN/NixA family nickel/cobalt transporter [Rhodoblastus acidophilus]
MQGLSQFFAGRGPLRQKLYLLFGGLVFANVAAWAWALAVFHDRPVLLGSAVLAFSLGLRHAVDADHIAAIDNSTRKLMQEGQRPVAVGLFFSLGHSTVVALLSIAVGFATATISAHFAQFKSIGSVIGTSASALFLLLLALFNLLVFLSVWKSFQALRRGERVSDEDFDLLLNQRGFLSRLFRPVFAMVRKSWHLYFVGLLFGLGFDTATEVALFGISATQAANGASFANLLVFPVLFTAGMSLVDSADGALMLGAYGWAYMKPVRKIYYNLTITAVSVLVALAVGGIETLGLIGNKLELHGAFWDAVGVLNDNFGLLGYGIIGLFIASWLISIAIYRLKGFDRLEAEV